MLKRIREYFNYKKNKKIAKRAIINTTATILSAVNKFVENKADNINFISKLIDSAKEIDNGELITMVIGELIDKFALDNEKIIKLIQNISNLSPEDISKIVTYSMIDIVTGDTETKE